MRENTLATLKEETFDILIIGGGATGCGIALDAAARGLKTALIEKRDYASGTSSKSTKLIHGGLRYLKQLDVGLVRETGTERAIVHRLAPHLVIPEKMLMPLIKNGTYGYWSTAFGLWVYDVLAKVEVEDKRKMLDKEETLEIEPLLDEEDLQGGGFYAEYRTDDARLTIELIKTAIRKGAVASNYVEAIDFTYDENEEVNGIEALDVIKNKKFKIKAKKVVAAGGPWVDELRALDGEVEGKRLHLTKGVHIVFPHEKIPLQHTIYFDVADGRMVFAIPRGRTTYVGTTDTTYTGNLNRVLSTKADAQYLIDAVNAMLPSVNVELADVESNWAGLRPLIHEDGKSPSELSRKDEIFVSDSGLIAIAGGKLTGYRKMAERIVDLVIEKMNLDLPDSNTEDIYLTEKNFAHPKDVESYIEEIKTKIKPLGLDPYYAWYLVSTYGRQADTILAYVKDFDHQEAPLALLRAETKFTLENEMVERLDDFFVRRTGRLYFDIHSVKKYHKEILEDMAAYFKWEENRKKEEQSNMLQLIKDAETLYESEMP